MIIKLYLDLIFILLTHLEYMIKIIALLIKKNLIISKFLKVHGLSILGKVSNILWTDTGRLL